MLQVIWLSRSSPSCPYPATSPTRGGLGSGVELHSMVLRTGVAPPSSWLAFDRKISYISRAQVFAHFSSMVLG
jgi:hypothetical protein